MIRQAAITLLVLTLAPGALPGRAAEPWPTTRFQAFVGVPFEGSQWQGDLVGVANLDDEWEDERPHPRAIADVERVFSEAARWYQKKGFPPPNLEPIVDTPQGPAYRIYLCRYREGGFRCGHNPETNKTSFGLYIPQCGNYRARYIYINWDVTIGDSLGMNEDGYQTAAHELMHAIIDNSPLGTPSHCGRYQRWITEGIPDAISWDIAEEIWVPNNRYEEGTSNGDIVKRYGYRPYNESLPQQDNIPIPTVKNGSVPAYGTSSFWRYLADSHPDGWGMLVTQKRGGTAGLLDTRMSGSPGWQTEVRWLDGALRGKFNRGLDQMYALFANHFAYRVAPFQRYAGKPAKDNLENWTGGLFGSCANVDLSQAAKQVVPLDIEPVASRCLWVGPTSAPGFTQITFGAKSQDPGVLQDIWIGQAGTTRVVRSVVAPAPNLPGWSVASWRDFPQDGEERKLYIVSNAARKPEQSERRSINLEVTRAGHTHSMWVGPEQPPPVAPQPQQPSYEKHAKSLARQQRDTAQQASEQMQLDRKSLNPNASGSTSVRRFPGTPPCPEPFKYAPCGPHLTINLTLLPGTYANPGGANAQGGIGAQAMGGLQAMSQSGIFGAEQSIRELQAQIDRIDGSAIGIAIPLIDYGFSGSFDNAAISVDMAGGEHLSAIGPPDSSGNTPLTGRVTIDEFSHHILSGSFVAPLAELVPNGDRPPIYKRRETVTGTFSSVAPWMSDERVQIQAESTDQIAEDVANSLGVSAEMVHKMKQEGSFPGGGASAGGGGAISENAGDCLCECDYLQYADELCLLFCEEEFAACPGD